MRPPYDHWPLPDRPVIEWPDGARLAVWIGLNVEYYQYGRPSTSIAERFAELVPDPMNHGWRDYGTRVGVWRLMDMLSRTGFPASVFLNSEVCRVYPEIVEAGERLDWAWVAHGRSNSILQTGMSEDEERAYLSDVVETIQAHTGRRPSGWLGPALTETENTPELLAELGLRYVCDWCNDDQPYPLRTARGPMISVPYSIEVNDIPLFLYQGLTGPEFERVLVDQFDSLYAESEESGRVMAIGLHPFLIGLPFRIRYLDRALQHIASHDGIWRTTSDAIADWYFERCYAEALESLGRRQRSTQAGLGSSFVSRSSRNCGRIDSES